MKKLFKIIQNEEIPIWNRLLRKFDLSLEINEKNEVLFLQDQLSPEQSSLRTRIELQESKFFGPFIHVVELITEFCTVNIDEVYEFLCSESENLSSHSLEGLEWKSLSSFSATYSAQPRLWIQPGKRTETQFLFNHSFQLLHLHIMRSAKLGENDLKALAGKLLLSFSASFKGLQNFDRVLFLHDSELQCQNRRKQLDILLTRWRLEIKSVRTKVEGPQFQGLVSDLSRLTYQWPDFEDYVYTVLSDAREHNHDRDGFMRKMTQSLVFWKQSLLFQSQLLASCQNLCEEQYEQKV